MPDTNGNKGKVLEWVRWGVAVLVIPLFVWGMSLKSTVEDNQRRIVEMEAELTETKADVKEEVAAIKKDVKADNERIQKMAVTIARMEGKIDNANSTLEKIERLLNTP